MDRAAERGSGPASTGAPENERDSAVVDHPLQERGWLVRGAAFAWRVLAGFDANNGFVLAGAMAYSAILSLVPMALMLTAILSTFVDGSEVLSTVKQVLRDVLMPGQAKMLVDAVATLASTAQVGGLFGALGTIFFATSGFRVMQSAFAQIFRHRLEDRDPRSLFTTMWMSVAAVAALGALLLARIYLGYLEIFGRVLDVAGSFISFTLVIAILYRAGPMGGVKWRPAFAAGAVVSALWELLIQFLAFYFGSFSQVNFVYGSMAAIVLILITIEYAAGVILIGAQAIAEVEQSHAAGRPWYIPAPHRASLRPPPAPPEGPEAPA